MFHTRLGRILALTALLGLITLPSFAATPPAGTLSESSPTVTWSGNPQPPTASANCNGPNNPACDNFALSIVPPSFAFVLEITVTASPADDYDLELYDPAGNLIASSGNSPGSPETISLVNPDAGTYTVSTANFAAALAYTGVAELVALDDQDPPGADAISFEVHPAPGGMGTNSGEPSVGVNWNTDRIMAIAGLETLRIEADDCASPSTTTWTDVSFTTTGITTLDPILFTDPITGRTFASQLGPKCSSMAFTDDDGDTWTPSQGCGINAGVDHQSVGGGPFAEPLVRDPNGPLYPHAVYYCSQDVAIAQCARSDTGGLTFAEATPIYNLTECGGLHGHVKIAPDDGTVYVPNKGCNGEQAVAVSDPDGPLGGNGLPGTWEVRRVPGTSSGRWDPSIGIGAQGTIYLGMTNGGRPMVAVSTDKGLTWSTPFDVGIGVGPTGADIQSTAFPVVVAGDDDRAAFGFLGAELGGDNGGDDPNSGHLWHAYVAVTYDGGQTWSTTSVDPGNPVQRGTICSGGTLCGGTRNLLDFNDIAVDREGRAVFVYADGCIGGCVKQGPNSGSELLTIARQKGGLRLFAAFDVTDVPAAPKTSAVRLDKDEATERGRITWDEPFDGNSEILSYSLYRREESETQASFLATVGAAERSYEDTTIAAGGNYCYQVTATNAFGESASCGEACLEETPKPPTPCEVPGIPVVEDPLGDTNALIDATGDPSLDLERVSIAEPLLPPGEEKLVVTIDVDSLATPHPSAAWRALWTSPDGAQYFVSLENCNAATGIQCSYGTFDGTLFSSAGSPEGCTFSADGSITITVDKALVGISDATDKGLALSGVEGRSQVFFGAACTGLLGNADSAGPGDYTIRTNAECTDDRPPIARDDAATTDQEVSVRIDVVANDTSFNGGLTVTDVTTPANGTVSNNGDGTVTYLPDPGFFGVDSFDYTIEDDIRLDDVGTVTITVNSSCPLEPTGSASDDFESGAPGWQVSTVENNLGPASPVWAVTADAGAHSPTNSFFSDARTLDLKDDRLVAPELFVGSTAELTFWHRFEFEAGFDGGVLEISTDDSSTWQDVVTAGGSFVEGGYNGMIDSGFNSPIAGRTAWTGGDSNAAMSRVVVDLGAFDGQLIRLRWRLATDPVVAGSLPGAGWWVDDVSVSGLLEQTVCNRPEAGDDTATTPENTPVVIDVLANDFDADGDPLHVDSVTQPANGSATLNGDDTVTYDPSTGFSGSDGFTYTVCDPGGLCDSATVTVTVTESENLPPIARDDFAATGEDQPVVIPVLANDEDPDGPSVFLVGVDAPQNGSATANANGTVTYTPDSGFFGTDSFTYTIRDEDGAEASATVHVTVTEGNDPPNARDDQATTQENAPVTIAVLANDDDPNGDAIVLDGVDQPANGTTTANPDGSVTYAPNPGFAGNDSFTYTIRDEHGATATATVSVTVNEAAGSGKVTGGGWIPGPGSDGKRNFGFNAKSKASGTSGRLTYDRNSGGIGLKGTVSSLVVAANMATFSGPCELDDGSACSYTVTVEDNGEPGDDDRFEIEVRDASGQVIHQAGDVLGGGNVQIH